MPGSQDVGFLLCSASLRSALGDLVELLRSADDDQYVQRPVAHFECCLGEQVRHVLDHVSCFVAALDGGSLDYDQRQRGTKLQHDRGAALSEIERLDRGLRRVDGRRAAESCVVVIHTYGEVASSTPAPSSMGREFSFVLSHTIHHLAMIGAMAAELGLQMAPHVGYAPSTLAQLRND